MSQKPSADNKETPVVIEEKDNESRLEMTEVIHETKFSKESEELADLALKQMLAAISKAANVEFNPLKDDNILSDIIDGTYNRLMAIIKLDVEKLIEDSRKKSVVDQNSKLVDKDGNVQDIIIEDDKLELFNGVDLKARFSLEKQISGMIKTYSDIIESLLKQKRFLAGQMYGSQSTNGQGLTRVTTTKKAILTGNQILEKMELEKLERDKLTRALLEGNQGGQGLPSGQPNYRAIPAVPLERVGVVQADLSPPIVAGSKPKQAKVVSIKDEDELLSDTYED